MGIASYRLMVPGRCRNISLITAITYRCVDNRLRRGHRSEQQMMWEISSRMKILEYFIVITSAIYFSDLNLEQSRINWELSESNHNLWPKFFVCRLDLYFGLSEVKNGCRWTLKEPHIVIRSAIYFSGFRQHKKAADRAPHSSMHNLWPELIFYWLTDFWSF